MMTSIEGTARIAGALIARPLRNRRTTWGASTAEVAASYPGDELVPQPRWSYTHAVDIDSPPEMIWPWLAQIGQGRGGFYSYQGLENLVGCRITNTTEILPEFGSLTVSDEVKLHPRAPGLRVMVAEPNKSLVLLGGAPGSPDRSLWAFHIVDAGNSCSRLIERGRYCYGGSLASRMSLSPTLMEPISFVMSRKMMLTIAELASTRTTLPTYRATGWRSVVNRIMTVALTTGAAPPRMVMLETVGCKSGQPRTTPVYVTEINGQRYLVAPYGATSWVHNIRADPHITLRRGSTTESVRAEEVDTAMAAPVLARYHASVKVTRPYFLAEHGAGADELAAEAHLHPVFRLIFSH